MVFIFYIENFRLCRETPYDSRCQRATLDVRWWSWEWLPNHLGFALRVPLDPTLSARCTSFIFSFLHSGIMQVKKPEDCFVVATVFLGFVLTSTTVRLLGGIVIAGSLLCLASILLLHALRTGYNPIRNAVSDYGVGKYRVWHRTAVLSLAAAGYALAVASTSSVKPESDVVIGFLLLFAIARTIIPFFLTVIEGQISPEGAAYTGR